jgi:F0F1-type ATP synthase assembly protein I
MSDSDEQERRQRLRRKGRALCLEGLGIAAIVGVITLGFGWFTESYTVAYGMLAFALFLFITGLVNILRGWRT